MQVPRKTCERANDSGLGGPRQWHSSPAKAVGSLEALGFVGANRAARLSVWHGPSALGTASKPSRSHLGVNNLSGCFYLTDSYD